MLLSIPFLWEQLFRELNSLLDAEGPEKIQCAATVVAVAIFSVIIDRN